MSFPKRIIIHERNALHNIIFPPDIRNFPNSTIRFVDVNRPGVIQPKDMQMGKQILFYMVEQDELEFIEFVRSTGDFVILPQTSMTGSGEEFSSFSELAGRKLGDACHLWNRSLSPNPVNSHIPQQGYFWLGIMQLEVVNVMRSKRIEQRLSMGRLHVEDKARRPDGSIVEKSAEFVNWFNELCWRIKKTYTSTFDGACLSP